VKIKGGSKTGRKAGQEIRKKELPLLGRPPTDITADKDSKQNKKKM